LVKRRAFNASFAVASVWPQGGGAQTGERIYRVAVLRPTARDDPTWIVSALRREGYVVGSNLVLEHRYAAGELSRLPQLMQELVNTKPDVLLAVGLPAIRAAIDARSTIPLIMFGNLDPVALGLVPNLARPSGNMTGVLITSQGTLAHKKLELLKEAVPQTRRIAMLIPDDPSIGMQVKEVQEAATLLGVDVVTTSVQGDGYEEAFSKIVAGRPDALFLAAHTYFVRDRKVIIDLAARYRLPAMYEWPDQVREGGLMAYGANLSEIFQQIANYIDKILKGARAGDLPVVMPAKFYLALNLRTARAIGLSFPPFLLARADELIE
jgi:putative ABC transport system substrate-binding protein